jgi:hypothetical protein
VVGYTHLDFDIWDPKNNMSAEYSLSGPNIGIGLKASSTAAGPYTDFVTDHDMTADGFGCTGSVISGGGGSDSFFILTLDCLSYNITVSTGFTQGFDVISLSLVSFSLTTSHAGPPRPTAEDNSMA